VYGKGLTLLTLPDGRKTRIELPAGSRIGLPIFAPDGAVFAFTRDIDDRTELWIGDAKSPNAKPIAGIRLNDVLGEGYASAVLHLGLSARVLGRGHGRAGASLSKRLHAAHRGVASLLSHAR
jgi:hypothetical protein